MKASSKKMPKGENLFIAAKVRPCSDKKNLRSPLITDSENSIITVKSTNKEQRFHLNNVFDENATQEKVYDIVAQPIVDDFLGGINGTIFAYGQTGSGKTYTMNGNKISETSDSPTRGIIPRSIESIFEILNVQSKKDPRSFTFSVKCRFIEIYNDTLYDLLQTNNAAIKILASGEQILTVGAAEFVVTSVEECLLHLRNGWKNRKTAETSMNRESSRSHAIFMLTLVTEEIKGTFFNRRTSCLNFVDLAGSERQKQTKNTGELLKEGACINQDLSHLATVIRDLGDAKKYIPYRDRFLTLLLRDSLGGNSRTSVIVTVHPNREFVGDTLSTLNFAENCKKVKNKAKVNEAFSTKDVEAWKKEIQQAKEDKSSLMKENQKLLKENQQLKERIEKRQKEDANTILILQNEKKMLEAEAVKYVQEVNEEKQNLQTQISLLERNVAEQKAEIQRVQEDKSSLMEEIQQLKKEKEQIEKLQKEDANIILILQNEKKMLEAEAVKHVQEVNVEKQNLQTQISLLEKNVDEQKEKIIALEKRQKEASELAKMKNEYDLQIKEIMDDLKNEKDALQRVEDKLDEYKLLVAEKDEVIEKAKNKMDAKILEYETLLEKTWAEHKKQENIHKETCDIQIAQIKKEYDLKIEELMNDLKKANEKVEDKQSVVQMDSDFNASFGGKSPHFEWSAFCF